MAQLSKTMAVELKDVPIGAHNQPWNGIYGIDFEWSLLVWQSGA